MKNRDQHGQRSAGARSRLSTRASGRNALVRGIVPWVIGFAAWWAPPVQGQLLERPTAIRNARIVTMHGDVIESGTIIVKGGKIDEVGADVRAPLLARVIDADGKTVTPGLIDAYSALGLSEAVTTADATASAWDGFEFFDREAFREALRNGVTTVYVAPSAVGVAGTGCVVRLAPEGRHSAGVLLKETTALAVNLGSQQSTTARLRTLAQVRKSFRTAIEYREALEIYEEELKEYLEKLKERNAKEATETDKKPEAEKPPVETPSPKPEEKKEEEEKPTPPRRRRPPRDSGPIVEALLGAAAAQPAHGEHNDVPDDFQRGPRRGAPRPAERPPAPPRPTEKQSDDELKEPTRPARDRASEMVLRAIDHEFPVRIRADHSADILNALALAEEFSIGVILESGTEAYLVSDEIAAAEVPVVLGYVARGALFQADQHRRHSPDNAAALETAGISWTLGSAGDEGVSARFVGFQAQLATAPMKEANPYRWLKTVTIDAARILGIDQQTGAIRRGLSADLVIWDGDPGEPGARVERVLIAGETAYLAR